MGGTKLVRSFDSLGTEDPGKDEQDGLCGLSFTGISANHSLPVKVGKGLAFLEGEGQGSPLRAPPDPTVHETWDFQAKECELSCSPRGRRDAGPWGGKGSGAVSISPAPSPILLLLHRLRSLKGTEVTRQHV